MTTTAKANAAATILAIDLGKYKSIAALERAADDWRSASFSTSGAELTRLIEKHHPDVILIEACLLCGWVRDLCGEVGVKGLVANTSLESRKFKHLQGKPDKCDALRL